MVVQALLQNKMYGGSVESRLEFALLLFRDYGGSLAALPGAIESLSRIEALHKGLNAHVQTLRLGDLCSSCAASTGGGCCSSYMSGETDSLQLLMNLMAGVAVDRINDNRSECCYLDPARGCIFVFKPMFCLNYNCHRIATQAGGCGLRQLEKLTGELLAGQYGLEMALFRFLCGHPPLLEKLLVKHEEP
jgi:hypothetical protein